MSGGPLSGFDSLLATVQMPGGVPVATVAVGSAGAKNAAVLAAQILALHDPAIEANLKADRDAGKEKVFSQSADIQKELS